MSYSSKTYRQNGYSAAIGERPPDALSKVGEIDLGDLARTTKRGVRLGESIGPRGRIGDALPAREPGIRDAVGYRGRGDLSAAIAGDEP